MLYCEDPFTKWEVELDPLLRSQTITIALDFDADKRVMSWRTFGAPHFDTEPQRGTATTPPLAELARQSVEHFFDYVGGPETPAEAVRAEIDAMDWPNVIGEK